MRRFYTILFIFLSLMYWLPFAIGQEVVDEVRPDVSLSVPEGAQNSAFDVTITFTEVVSDFAQADLTVSGTATASITAWTTTDNTVFTATITPTTSGDVTLSVAADVATDAASNNNTASETQTVSVDIDAPEVSISVPEGAQTAAFDVVITFTESVSGFEQSDLTFSGTAAANITALTSTDDTIYTATLTPTTGGRLTLSVAADVATDAASNNNTAAEQTVTVDLSATWMPDESLRNIIRAFHIRPGSNEPLTQLKMLEVTSLGAPGGYKGIKINDITGLEYATNLTVLSLAKNSISDLSPLKKLTGLTTLDMEENSISDVAPLSKLTSLTELWLSDNSISAISLLSDLTSLQSLGLRRNSISDVSELAKLTNLQVLWLNGNSISAISGFDGLVNLKRLDLGSNSISDVNGLSKLSSLEYLWLGSNSLSDVTKLGDLTSLKYLNLSKNSVSNLTPLEGLTSLTELYLSENSLSDLTSLSKLTNLFLLYLSKNEIRDVSPLKDLTSIKYLRLSGNPILDTSPLYDLLSANDGSITSIDITVSKYAPWDVNKDESVDARDVALVTAAIGQSGGGILNSRTDVNRDGTVDNADLTQVTDNVTDPDVLSVIISVPEGVQTGIFDVVITFTQVVSDFAQSDVSVSGTANASITAWASTSDITYTATLTPTTDGEVVLNVAAAVATDASSNSNTASDLQTVDVDIEVPEVSLAVPEDVKNGAFDVVITFTESVSGFEQSEVSVSGTATASITAWETTDNTVFTATLTPTTSGEVTLGVAAAVATDVEGYSNTASDAQTVDIDMDAPSVSLAVPEDAQYDTFDVVITFTESVSGFEQSEVSVSGTAMASITAWATTDDTVFTATLTPTTDGTVVVSVAADVATDVAGNNNTASDSQTVSVPEVATEWMPDGGLRTVVRSTLGLGQNNPLTQAKMTKLTTLEADALWIRDITGLEYATNLKELDLSRNGVSVLTPLEGLTSLTKLELIYNGISDVNPLSKLTNLTMLTLSENGISDVNPLSKLTSLMTLYLRENTISDVSPLSKLTNLTQLNLHDNSVSDVSALSDVSELSKLTSLQVLWLGENEISDVSALAKLTNLGSLYLHENEISDVSHLKGLTNLKSLALDENEISDVSALEKLTDLKWLSLKGNPISDTSPLYDLLSANGGSLVIIDISVSQYAPWDVNKDGVVDASDVALVTAAIGQSGADILNSRTDVNGDGTVDNKDLTLVTDNLDTDDDAAAPLAMAGIASLLDRATLESLDPEVIAAQLSILRSKSDGSLKYQRAIALLESVLVALRPVETLLLANYPNPFNPETWLPYHLADASDVVITIYDMRGTVVRRLELGHQREGYYTSRARAAYWDGRNHIGERVASGVYFYQLEADDMSLLRKMVILK